MARRFNKSQFHPPTPKPKELSLEEGILIAFEQGRRAARMDKLRSENLYAPSTQPELYDAWCCGYDEEDDVYVVATREDTAA